MHSKDFSDDTKKEPGIREQEILGTLSTIDISGKPEHLKSDIYREENGYVWKFYCTIQTLGCNPLFQLNRFRLVQLYSSNLY